MSDIGHLKDVVKLYLQSAFPAVENHPLLSQGDASTVETAVNTLILQAANNARKWGERQHDFEAAGVTVEGTLVAGGSLALDGMKLYGTNTAVELKTVESVYIESEGSHTPIRFERKRRTAHKVLERIDRVRYGDAYEPVELVALIIGDDLWLHPELDEDVTLVVDGNQWLDDYTADADTDFFLKHGFEYMQWACIVEVNHLLQTFVFRQEGSLYPPEKLRDRAWENFLSWDAYKIDGQRNVL